MNPKCMHPTQTYSSIYKPALSPSSPGFTGILLNIGDMRGEGPPELAAMSLFGVSALSEESTLTIPVPGVGLAEILKIHYCE